ncbi:MAG: S-methyl-5-thioribose-1-phosphate isomerase [Myxococcota bacterium]
MPIRRTADGTVEILDQRKLPFEEVWIPCTTVDEVWLAIHYMAIRGAPAIGVAAGMGMALGARALPRDERFAAAFERLADHLVSARPTAVNLAWAVDRMRRTLARMTAEAAPIDAILAALDLDALAIAMEDLAQNRAIGAHGVPLLPPAPAHRPLRILTHCNTGSLATAGWGTALGIIRSAWEAGVSLEVYADETRPYLQGARLTAWELQQDGIPVTLIPDVAAGYLMRQGELDVAIVGADRIARNGDTANKIGTYTVAVLCARHGLPFYVAAPTTTLDLTIPDGSHIPIEERPAKEVLEVFGRRIAPEVPVRNPSFDVTPGELVTAIVTEHGAARAPYSESLPALAPAAPAARSFA